MEMDLQPENIWDSWMQHLPVEKQDNNKLQGFKTLEREQQIPVGGNI